MRDDSVTFQVTNMAASVPEGVPILWEGQEISSGPLLLELDPDAPPSYGTLDYASRRARVEFRVQMRFPEFAGTMLALGLPPELAAPARAVIRSEGDILEDHSFALSGRSEIRPHDLFSPDETAASVLPGT